jgi:hypothetical protein
MSTSLSESRFPLGNTSVATYVRDVISTVAAGFRSHALLYAVAILMFVLGLIECWYFDLHVNFGLFGYVYASTGLLLVIAGAAKFIIEFFKLWKAKFKGRLGPALAEKTVSDIASPVRLSNIFHAIAINAIFVVGFVAIKKAIPYFNGGFPWDTTLMHVDKALHGGTLPHEWLMPVIGSPEFLFLISLNYSLWFFVVIFCWFYFGFTRQDNMLRHRYILAYLLCWFLGTCVTGTLLASGGPCFYGELVPGENPYAGLMSHLRATHEVYPILALPTQDALWQSFKAGAGEVEGISAMPSLHIAITTLIILMAFKRKNYGFMSFMLPFCILIFFGSIILGWHYAIDGYIGAAIAIVSWYAAGGITRWYMPDGVPASASIQKS